MRAYLRMMAWPFRGVRCADGDYVGSRFGRRELPNWDHQADFLLPSALRRGQNW